MRFSFVRVLLGAVWLTVGSIPTVGQAAPLHQRVAVVAFAGDAARAIGGIDPYIAMGLVYIESRGDPSAISHKGALGAAQIMPQTARELGILKTDILLFDPELNVATGLVYLKQNLRRFQGSYPMALAAYNAGPTRTERLGRVPRAARAYVRSVSDIARRLRRCSQDFETRGCILRLLAR